MSGTESPVRLTVDAAVAQIVLNRPSSLNAIDLSMAQALGAAIGEVAADPGVRVLLLRGEGRCFCGGGDVKAMHAHADELPAFVGRIIDAFHEVVLALVRLRVPVVLAVQGAAAGGGFSLAMAVDFVLAARSARFVVAYPQLGTSTDGGLSWQLQRRLGPARALALLTRPGPISADDAKSLQLVHEVVEDAVLQREALQLAQQLAALPPQALRELKALVHAPSIDGLREQLAREKAAFQRCAASADFAERVAAFAQRATSA